MNITIDIDKRIEWLKKRVSMTHTDESYIRLQMQDLVIETVREYTKVYLNNDDTISKKLG